MNMFSNKIIYSSVCFAIVLICILSVKNNSNKMQNVTTEHKTPKQTPKPEKIISENVNDHVVEKKEINKNFFDKETVIKNIFFILLPILGDLLFVCHDYQGFKSIESKLSPELPLMKRYVEDRKKFLFSYAAAHVGFGFMIEFFLNNGIINMFICFMNNKNKGRRFDIFKNLLKKRFYHFYSFILLYLIMFIFEIFILLCFANYFLQYIANMKKIFLQ